MVFLGLQDYAKRKKRIFSNLKLKIPKITYLTSAFFNNIPKNMSNCSVLLDEVHNWLDCRDSIKTKNKIRSHFILQSRHSGRGTMDIYYTTQEIGQVDKRLRNNTDVLVTPTIMTRDDEGIPEIIKIEYRFISGNKPMIINEYFNAKDVMEYYDTHEIIDIDA